MGRPSHVVVIGAGIAGLVAALELSKKGLRVTVLEAAPNPGGRTTSWTDSDGHERDTAPHLIVDHYVNFLDVLDDLGISGEVSWMRRPMYLRRSDSPTQWRLHHAPAPLHLLAPARRVDLRALPAVVLAGLRILTLPEDRLRTLDDRSYGEWQQDAVGERWLDLADAASEAACFLPAAEASAFVVLSWLRTLMRTSSASHVASWPSPFQEAFVGPLVEAIEQHGGRVYTSTAGVDFDVGDGRIRSVLARPAQCEGPLTRADGTLPLTSDGESRRIACDFAVSAVPPQTCRTLFGDRWARAAGIERAMELSTVPAMSVTLWLDRPVGPAPQCPPMCNGTWIRGFIDWASVGRRGPTDPAVIQLVLSDARRHLEVSDASVIEAVWAEYQALWPPAGRARLINHVVERIEAAMVACVPGAQGRRPGTETTLENLFLAGDWTSDDPKPSMEAAAISGRRAADAVLQAIGRPGLRVLSPPEGRAIEAARRVRALVA